MKRIEDITYNNSDELCEGISAINSNVILSFSTGKDSIAAWLQLKKYFKNILPVYFTLIPGLSFVEESLKYYSDFFGTKIYQLPHPRLYQWLGTGMFQPPERADVLSEIEFARFEFEDAFTFMREDYFNNDENVLSAVGVRAADNPRRYISIQKSGAINFNKRQFFPIYDWKKDRLISEFQNAKIKLPVDYNLFGRSFDGLFIEYIKPIKENYPKDYEKIKFYFPLIEAEIKKYEYRSKYVGF